MTTEIVRAIKEKAIDARSYPFDGPQWLIVEVTEQPGRFKESMRRVLTRSDLQFAPFERVFIHDGLDLFEVAGCEKDSE